MNIIVTLESIAIMLQVISASIFKIRQNRFETSMKLITIKEPHKLTI